jgi:hypothetical protein
VSAANLQTYRRLPQDRGTASPTRRPALPVSALKSRSTILALKGRGTNRRAEQWHERSGRSGMPQVAAGFAEARVRGAAPARGVEAGGAPRVSQGWERDRRAVAMVMRMGWASFPGAAGGCDRDQGPEATRVSAVATAPGGPDGREVRRCRLGLAAVGRGRSGGRPASRHQCRPGAGKAQRTDGTSCGVVTKVVAGHDRSWLELAGEAAMAHSPAGVAHAEGVVCQQRRCEECSAGGSAHTSTTARATAGPRLAPMVGPNHVF